MTYTRNQVGSILYHLVVIKITVQLQIRPIYCQAINIKFWTITALILVVTEGLLDVAVTETTKLLWYVKFMLWKLI